MHKAIINFAPLKRSLHPVVYNLSSKKRKAETEVAIYKMPYKRVKLLLGQPQQK